MEVNISCMIMQVTFLTCVHVHTFINSIKLWLPLPQYLKITEKVAYNIASEPSYGDILSGQKFIKNAKKWSFLKTWSLWSNSVTRQVNFYWTKKMRHFGWFSNTVFLLLNGDMEHVQVLVWKTPQIEVRDRCRFSLSSSFIYFSIIFPASLPLLFCFPMPSICIWYIKECIPHC